MHYYFFFCGYSHDRLWVMTIDVLCGSAFVEDASSVKKNKIGRGPDPQGNGTKFKSVPNTKAGQRWEPVCITIWQQFTIER